MHFSPSKVRPPAIRDFALALSVATLLFGAHFRAHLDPKVRFLNDWNFSDAASLITAVLLPALVFLGVRILFSSTPRRVVFARAAFLVLFVQGVLVSLRPP